MTTKKTSLRCFLIPCLLLFAELIPTSSAKIILHDGRNELFRRRKLPVTGMSEYANIFDRAGKHSASSEIECKTIKGSKKSGKGYPSCQPEPEPSTRPTIHPTWEVNNKFSASSGKGTKTSKSKKSISRGKGSSGKGKGKGSDGKGSSGKGKGNGNGSSDEPHHESTRSPSSGKGKGGISKGKGKGKGSGKSKKSKAKSGKGKSKKNGKGKETKEPKTLTPTMDTIFPSPDPVVTLPPASTEQPTSQQVEQPTISTPTPITTPPIVSPTNQPVLNVPTSRPSFIQRPTSSPMEMIPTIVPVPQTPTAAPADEVSIMPTPSQRTPSPTITAVETIPTRPPVESPTNAPIPLEPTSAPSVGETPTTAPVTQEQTEAPVAVIPTNQPVSDETDQPTAAPIGEDPTAAPALLTAEPTISPAEVQPSVAPVENVTISPTGELATEAPVTPPPEATPSQAPDETELVVLSTPWALEYTASSQSQPIESHFEEVEILTLQYLQDYLQNYFGAIADTNFISFSGSATGIAFRPERIGFEGEATFSSTSTTVPTRQDLDTVLAQAFQAPAVQALITILQQLPAENPFSTTSAITFSSGRRITGSRGYGIMVLASGFFAMAMLLSGLLLRKIRSRQDLCKNKRPLGGLHKNGIFTYRTQEDPTYSEDISVFTSLTHIPSMPGFGTQPSRETKGKPSWTNFQDDQIEIQFGLWNNPEEETTSIYDPLFQSPFYKSSKECA